MIDVEAEGIQFGIHFILDGYGAAKETLTSSSDLQDLLERLPAEVGMHTIHDPVVVEVGPNNKKDPGGISGFVMVAESHIAIHTFPNRGFVSIDVYTCNDTLPTDILQQRFTEHFKLQNADAQVIARGTKYPEHDIY